MLISMTGYGRAEVVDKDWALTVITSYSIHYTKLYDVGAGGAAQSTAQCRMNREVEAFISVGVCLGSLNN